MRPIPPMAPLLAILALLPGLSVLAQAVIYVGLIRLLVVDTGALSWAAMGVRRSGPAGGRLAWRE